MKNRKKTSSAIGFPPQDPHAFLGMHFSEPEGIVVRVYDPDLQEVCLLSGKDFSVRTPMVPLETEGFFAAEFPKKRKFFPYRIEKHYRNGSIWTGGDGYSFTPFPGDIDLYLFNKGEHQTPWEFMGARVMVRDGVPGTEFAVWAPNAVRVSVVGSFNGWDGRRDPMRLLGSSGIWELFVPGAGTGDLYKFEILAKDGTLLLKRDPYARHCELRPGTAGVIPSDRPFLWHDRNWMDRRTQKNLLSGPVSIYEVHLGSWRHPSVPVGENGFSNYRDLAEALGNYALENGFTHVELLPVSEHPLDRSWGYQVTGYYAPTSRYGSPEEFAAFVDILHQKGIGVLMDWVPAHFPKDEFSLGRFDGSALYEHADPRQGEQQDWGTYVFNFGRCEVNTFLIGSALYWLREFHLDGLRVDAVASMLYLDYSRKAGEWIPNRFGGNENLEAVEFLKKLNTLTHQLCPGTVMAAEESTAWPGVSRPVYSGGLGFTFKWNMGWMHDTLDYFSLDPVYRSWNHNRITFSLMYAFSENFILPLSHDEVVHGKRSLLGRMPGDRQQQFANLRALYCYMMAHPGKKLLFMGSEFAQDREWNEADSLDWNLLEWPLHGGLNYMLKQLNRLYQREPALWEDDFTPQGYQWLDGGDARQSILSFIRWDQKHQDPVVVILNLTPVVRNDYITGVPLPGEWKEIFNSDASEYGGTGLINGGTFSTVPGLWHGQDQHITLRLPWLGAIFLKKA